MIDAERYGWSKGQIKVTKKKQQSWSSKISDKAGKKPSTK